MRPHLCVPRISYLGLFTGGALLLCAGMLWGAQAAAAKHIKPPPGPAPELESPVRVAKTWRGELLVTDQRLKMVLMLDPTTLDVLATFPVQGRPIGVACSGRGRNLSVYVGNADLKRVEVYDAEGHWQYHLGNADDYTWHPADIAVDEDQELVFVVDSWRKTVKVYTRAGALVRTIPDPGPDPALLTHPGALAVDPARQEIYVSDYGDPFEYIKPRVQVFGYDGTLVRTIPGKLGMMGFRFSRPQGMAVDAATHLYLVDCVSGEVLIIDGITGALLKTLGDFGTDPGQLQFPLDVVVDEATLDVFVTNHNLSRIEVFTGGGVLP